MLQILQHFYQIDLTFSDSELNCCKFCNFEPDKQAFSMKCCIKCNICSLEQGLQFETFYQRMHPFRQIGEQRG